MKTYFCISDVHGFYNEMIDALNMAKYSKDNLSHILLVNGDVFDRGPDANKVYEFLTSIPKEQLILIKGNHESLVLEVVQRSLPKKSDYTNGTVDTIFQLADVPKNIREIIQFGAYAPDLKTDVYQREALWKEIVNHSKVKEVISWLESSQWLNYYELDNFIFTHAFIPLKVKDRFNMQFHYDYKDLLKYFSNWRTNATNYDWYESRWGNPITQYQEGLFSEEEKKGKTLVVGHWHVSDFHKILGQEETHRHDIYFSKGIIGLDGGVRLPQGKYEYDCNVLVIKNSVCYNKRGEILYAKQ
jgi:serine/threonine protein phosphatase 1